MDSGNLLTDRRWQNRLYKKNNDSSYCRTVLEFVKSFFVFLFSGDG